jgi:DNA helicase HerA-like ATPase
VRGIVLQPKHHGRVQVEIVGEELNDGAVVPPRRRPLPNSPVFVLDSPETADVLGTGGNVRLGVADGHEDIEVCAPADSKVVFPRHVGILGTTDGGKSTTVSGQVAQLQKIGTAVVLFDTEGKYTAINKPTDDEQMKLALKRRGLEVEGVDDTHVYHLVGRETANPSHPDVRSFRLDFSELSPYAFKEILGLTDAQETRFFQAYEACKLLLRDLGIYPRRGNQQEQREALEVDELETGYPRMTLSHLLDVGGAILHRVAGTEGDPRIFNDAFKNDRELFDRRQKLVKTDSAPSWRVLMGKLWRLHRLNIFDNRGAESVDYEAMLQPGRVTIVDLSDMESTEVRNMVIAQILKGIQRQQDRNYQEARQVGNRPTPTMVFIEEAHEFLSSQRIRSMPVLFEQVARIARRGRKRWLGLVFVTQLPQHLPDEVLGLINNWVLHKIGDSNVVSRLRRSIGGVDDSLWSSLPNLAPGQAGVSFSNLSRPLMVAIDPTPCKLLMVE